MSILSRFLPVIILAAQLLLAGALTRYWGTALGLVIYAVIISALCGLAAALLATSSLGQITWKNRLAGVLLPWCWLAGGGSLSWLVGVNIVASVLLGGLVAIAHHLSFSTSRPSTSSGPTLVLWLTLACWVLLVVAWGWLIRVRLQNSGAGPLRDILVPLVLPPLVLAASAMSWHAGYARWALWIAAVPLLIVLLPMLFVMMILLTARVRGKPIRWN